MGPGSASDELVTFTFGPPSAPGRWSEVRVSEVQPPFALGGSGEPVDLAGSMFVELRVEGAAVADETGQPTYAGPTRIVTPELVRIHDIAQLEAFEGVVTWVVGMDFTCVALETSPAANTITLSASIPVP